MREIFMEYNESDSKYAKNQLNDMLTEILGVPKKYQGKRSFGGYWSLINKWLHKNKYDLGYIYYVVSNIQKRDGKHNVGFIEGAFRSEGWIKSYDPEKHRLPSGGDREKLLAAGHTIDTLPAHLLTREERRQRKQKEVTVVNVTDEDRDSLSEFLSRAGGVVGKNE
jgi:hypothetical protein